MAARDQVAAKLGEVVNLSVEDDPDRTIFVGNRLVTTGNVNDRKSPHAYGCAAFDVIPGVIRPAMRDDIAHLFDQLTVCKLAAS